MSRTGRGLRILRKLLPFVVSFLRDRKRWIVLGSPASRTVAHHQRRAERLTNTIGGLGPTFIKLAQLLSARADIFPEPYLSSIGLLQDQVPADDAARVVQVIEDELGDSVDNLFEDFDREPIAAASLGQVHRARVDGEDVVVKVLRPDVEELVALDLDISFRLLYWLNILFPNHHVRALTNTVREFSVKVKEEMDFRIEAENMEQFHRFFGSEPGVRAPIAVSRFTRRRVLVMEYVEGTKIDGLDEAIAAGSIDLDAMMERLTGLYLRMMMVDGFMHADPHPGNLLVQDDGTIVVLDWGMVLRVPRWTREAILSLALAVEREDLDAMISGMYRLGMISPEVSRGEIREAATEIMHIVGRVHLSNRDRIDEIVREIFDAFYTWPLMLPQELVYFFRTSALLEGIGIRYDRNFDGVALVRRVIGGVKREILDTAKKEPASAAKDALGEVGHVIRAVRELVERTEREELRLRVHPRDIQSFERFLHLQSRRLLLSIFASCIALISSVIYIALGNIWLLAAGLIFALVLFVLVFFIPTHLLENPLRHARGIRPNRTR
jgi:predicted unusual protein kinase regulating ubiquinone biosynthesis (AarF/ABC1/UbiB family)